MKDRFSFGIINYAKHTSFSFFIIFYFLFFRFLAESDGKWREQNRKQTLQSSWQSFVSGTQPSISALETRDRSLEFSFNSTATTAKYPWTRLMLINQLFHSSKKKEQMLRIWRKFNKEFNWNFQPPPPPSFSFPFDFECLKSGFIFCCGGLPISIFFHTCVCFEKKIQFPLISVWYNLFIYLSSLFYFILSFF